MGLLKNTSFYTALNLLGSLVALGINSFLAATFGAGKELEAFLILMAFFLAISGSFTNALFSNFVPWFLGNKNHPSNNSELPTPDSHANWSFANVFFIFYLLLILAVSFLLIYYKESYLPIIAPTYGNDKDMSVLESLLNPFIAFFIVSTTNFFLGVILTALKKIVIISLLTPVTNISTFLIILSFKDFSVETLPIAYFSGSFINLVIFLFFLRKTPFIKNFFKWKKFKLVKLRLSINKLKKYFYAIRYWIVVLILCQSAPVFEKIIAAGTFTGAILALDFAQKTVSKLVNVFCTGISTSSSADLALLWDKGDKKKFQTIQQRVFNLMLLFSCFIVIPMVLLSHDIAELLFFHGKMNEANIKYIGTAMLFYGINSTFSNLNIMTGNCFIAMRKLKVLNFFNLISTLVYLCLSYALVNKFSYLSLPISLLITNILGFAVLYLFFMRETKIKFVSLIFIFKVILLAVLSSVFLFLAKSYIDQNLIESTSVLFLRISGVGFLFCLFFYGGALLLKINEIKEINDRIKKALKSWSKTTSK